MLASRIKNIALILTLLLPLSLMAQGPGKRAYLEAENMRKQNKFQEAIELYNQAIRAEPSNYKYYFQRGKCEYGLKQFDLAKESFKSTVEYNRNFTPAYSLLAKIYKNEKDYNSAIYYYNEAAKYETNNSRKVQYQLLLVNLLLKEKRTSEAKRILDEARRLAPNNPNILYYVADIYGSEGNWAAAKDAYERALKNERLQKASPATQAKFYYGLGLAYSKLGDNANARRAWSKANFGPYKRLISEQLKKSNHVYYYKIAVSYYLNNEFNEALKFADQALSIQSNFSNAMVLKAKVARKQGNSGRSIEYLRQAVQQEQQPVNRYKLLSMLAYLQLDNNDSRGALSTIQNALQINPNGSASLISMKARAEYQSGRYSDAVRTLEKLLGAGVDTKSKAKYSFMLGMAAKKNSDMERAREAFKNAMYGPYKPAAKAELDKING